MDIFEIGEIIRRHRKEQGMTQQQLADAGRISRSRLNTLETGGAFDLRVNTVLSLFKALGLSMRVSDSPDGRPVYEDLKREAEYDTPGMD